MSLTTEQDDVRVKCLVKKVKEDLVAVVVSNKDKSRISLQVDDRVFLFSNIDDEQALTQASVMQNNQFPLLILKLSDTTETEEAPGAPVLLPPSGEEREEEEVGDEPDEGVGEEIEEERALPAPVGEIEAIGGQQVLEMPNQGIESNEGYPPPAPMEHIENVGEVDEEEISSADTDEEDCEPLNIEEIAGVQIEELKAANVDAEELEDGELALDKVEELSDNELDEDDSILIIPDPEEPPGGFDSDTETLDLNAEDLEDEPAPATVERKQSDEPAEVDLEHLVIGSTLAGSIDTSDLEAELSSDIEESISKAGDELLMQPPETGELDDDIDVIEDMELVSDMSIDIGDIAEDSSPMVAVGSESEEVTLVVPAIEAEASFNDFFPVTVTAAKEGELPFSSVDSALQEAIHDLQERVFALDGKQSPSKVSRSAGEPGSNAICLSINEESVRLVVREGFPEVEDVKVFIDRPWVPSLKLMATAKITSRERVDGVEVALLRFSGLPGAVRDSIDAYLRDGSTCMNVLMELSSQE